MIKVETVETVEPAASFLARFIPRVFTKASYVMPVCLMMRLCDWPCLASANPAIYLGIELLFLLQIPSSSLSHPCSNSIIPHSPHFSHNSNSTLSTNYLQPTCPELSRSAVPSPRSVPATTSTRPAVTPRLPRRGSKVWLALLTSDGPLLTIFATSRRSQAPARRKERRLQQRHRDPQGRRGVCCRRRQGG